MSSAWAALAAHYGTAGAMSRRLHIDPAQRFVYVNNPKVVCTTIKATLNVEAARQLGVSYTPRRMRDVHDHRRQVLLQPTALGAERFDAVMRDPSVLRFSFVRDPVARLVSAYADKLAGGAGSSRMAEKLWKHMGLADDCVLTQEAFAEACIDDPEVLHLDQHWHPQRKQLAFDIIDYGFLGAQERFDADFARVLARLFPQGAEVLDTRALLGHRTQPAKLAPLSEALQTRLRETYAEDYDMLAEIRARGLDRLA